ncbi:quinoprotein dehydrogenase-associated SoxYZ-like carrier [Nitrogeniibacter mangrovi]|uniref:Quinoprotein dehydrogenase-associated SoxYZ-like carrier n=1 Tax=Nitrogeniibacter mangrovi TaxID=2016596 RepID=A0A6C1B1P7_9RHOO|nr:quinoprotein dehydrogenase-associated SoxYZ-like carrier [Nitrogeniibacter mangrovi]QID17487.1 quinoprotein dehydrogenase-associated SoxYZ-like carrier [Nitrogeniibacter mangrovi]
MTRAQAWRWFAHALFLLACTPAFALDDPLKSARWDDMRQMFFADQPVQFDERVRVLAPLSAENPMEVPITVDAETLPDIAEVIVFADFNPIIKMLAFEPQGAVARLSFRVKLQQSTPVRAAARTKDGMWHVGGTWINTTGGGCSAPSVGSASPVWQTRLNEVSGRLWHHKDGTRIRVRIIHPMDTGLAERIPAFYIETLNIDRADGTPLMRIHSFEPVAENPLFTLDLPEALKDISSIRVEGRDNNGNLINAVVED